MSALLSEAVAMGASALWVAAVALPVGVVCGGLARRWRVPVVPRYRKGFARWDGFDAFLLFAAGTAWPVFCAPAFEANGVFQSVLGPLPGAGSARTDYRYHVWVLTGLILAPLLAVAFAAWKRRLDRERTRPGREAFHRFVADIAAGVAAWAVLLPLTLAVHFAVNVACSELGIPVQEHRLKDMRVESTGDVLLLFLGACVVAPFFEEMAFRRVLVPWASRSSERAKRWGGLNGWPYGGWVLMALAAAFAVSQADAYYRLAAVAFVGLCAVALAVLGWRARRSPALRPASAVLATATLFAAVHSQVWPTPIPLLVLGVGLGWLVLRTKGVTAAVVAHGLFNAVSAVYLLRT